MEPESLHLGEGDATEWRQGADCGLPRFLGKVFFGRDSHWARTAPVVRLLYIGQVRERSIRAREDLDLLANRRIIAGRGGEP